MLLFLAALATGGAPAIPAPWRPTTVLVLPIEPREGASKDLCEQLTAAFVAEAGTKPAYQLVALRELENTMGQETLRQVAGCDSVGCAVEIAHALDREQIVMGSLGAIGGGYFLSLSRVRSRDGQILRRVVRRFPNRDAGAVLEETGPVARELMLDERQATPSTAATVAPLQAARDDGHASRAPLLLGLGAAGLAGVSAVIWLAAGGAAALAAGVLVMDLRDGDWSALGDRRHGVPFKMALLGDAAGIGATALCLAALIALAAAAAAVGAAWMLR